MFDIASPGLVPALSVPFALVENAFRRLTHLVQDMNQEELEYVGPEGNTNSTATLIAHLARTDLEYLLRVMGKPVTSQLETEYGPHRSADDTLPAVTGRTAGELLASYRRVIDMGRDYLKGQTEADATREVAIPWWPQPATVRYVLWHMAGHSMFHQGQIRRLREWYKLRGA